MILQARPHHDPVQIGNVYRRFGRGSVVETARVLDVGRDRMGIPHVRFELHVTRGSSVPTTESRTLALDVFLNRYRDSVAGG